MGKRKVVINVNDERFWRAGNNPIDRMIQVFLARALAFVVILILLRALLGGIGL